MTIRSFSIVVAYTVLFSTALYFVFSNLDGRALWRDEAETAVLARNVARFGVPRTIDETNHITFAETFQNQNADIWKWSPWLQEYVAAGSYRLFGTTTWASRAPFALIAWVALVLFAVNSWKIYRQHGIVLSATALLGFSEIFLLHARQCRYYSLSIFFAIVLMFAVYATLRAQRSGPWLISAALIGQFYSNYILAIASATVLIPLGWIAYRRGNFRKILVAIAFFILATLPWLLFAQVWRQLKEITSGQLPEKIGYYIREFHFHFIPLIFGLLPFATWLTKKFWRRNRDVETEVAPLSDRNISLFERILVSAFPLYGIVILIAPGAFSRYLLPLLPIACLVCAAWSFRYLTWPVAALVIVIQIATNYLSIAPVAPWTHAHHWRWPLLEYCSGLNRAYANRISDVLNFFFREGHAGETICGIDPEYPLMFYTRLRVIDGRYISCGPDLPKWVLPQSSSCVVCQESAPLPETASWQYEKIVIQVLDSAAGDSMPDPNTYQYRATDHRVPFIIFRKKETSADGSP